jgi:TonB family protein
MTFPIGKLTTVSIAASVLLAACGERATLPATAGYGPHPQLTAPNATLIPTIKIATIIGWSKGETPTAAAGLKVSAFAQGLQNPRRPYVLPNGDVLVAETDAPPQPDEYKGFRGFVQGLLFASAGSHKGSANRITLLRDTNGDGVADVKTVFLSDLHSPFGMVLVGNDFYVANTDSVMRYAYTPGATEIAGPGTKIVDLPAGTRNHHWTKDLIASPDGTKLYVSVGSNSNVGENGLEIETGRAAVWEIDLKTGTHRIFASGLRNANGLSFAPGTNTLWVAVNERDEIGSDLVPDYITHVQDGGFYGWPFSYYGQHVDTRAQPQNPKLVAKAIAPDYATGSHTASLGLAFSRGAKLGDAFSDGVFVSQHGSWNRDPPAGYRVIFIPFKNGKPSGTPVDVLTGFLTADDEAKGRPVGIALDKTGALLVADDAGNMIWRVTRKGVPNASTIDASQRCGQGVTSPTPTNLHAPSAEAYPPLSVMQGEEGATRLGYTVAENGSVRDVHVEKSSGFARLDSASMQAATTWRFSPAVKNGKPVACAWETIVAWRLTDNDDASASFNVVEMTKADYPPGAFERGEQGVTTITLQISENGTVTNAAMTRSSGYADLDGAALNIVMTRWKISPAMLSGRGIRSVAELSVVWSAADQH